MMELEGLSEPNVGRLNEVSADLPQGQSLEDIITAWKESSKSLSRRDLLLGSLARLSRIPKPLEPLGDQTSDASTLLELASKDLESLHSKGSLGKSSGGDDASDSLSIEAAIACLGVIASAWNCSINDSTLVCVTAYTDPQDPWTTEEAARLASRLLRASIPDEGLKDFVVNSILQEYLRPLFSKSTTRVTASGRPSRFPNQAHPRDDLETPLWKNQGRRATSVFYWAVKASDDSLLRNNWPLFTPVLLAISEDQDTLVRTRGLEILRCFLGKCPSQILKSTGIGTVFEESIFPSLLFLPSLTPEEESVNIMRVAYDALIILAEKEPDLSNLTRRQLLDKVVRDGILMAYGHASHYAMVVETLMRTTIAVVNCLGIFSAKHLQSLLSIASSTMTDSFSISRPSVIMEAVRAVNAIMINCWPRVSEEGYDGEVMRAIANCWLNLYDGELLNCQTVSNDVDQLINELKQTVKILQAIRRAAGTDPLPRLHEVLKEEPKLEGLFSQV